MLEVPFELHYRKFRFDDDEFYDFCLQNDNLKFERDSIGNIIVMPNTGGKTGNLNSKLNARLVIWNEILEPGLIFDSSTAFRLSSSAVRSPDVAWVSNERWNMLSDSEQEKFPPLCPDFIIELMSITDNETDAKNKMTDAHPRVPPPLKWHGGKYYLAARIVALMPQHKHYVEPYAGGLSVLLAKDPDGVSEVVNDLHGQLTNFWRVLQSEDTFDHFQRVL